MFPVSFSSFGDIVAAATLLHDIVSALNEVRGSPAEYRDLLDELRHFAQLLYAIDHAIGHSSDETLRSEILSQVEHCCTLVGEAFSSTVKFEPLTHNDPSRLNFGERIRRGMLKVEWRLRKQHKAKEYKDRLAQARGLLVLSLTMYVNH
jgi:hypothetical protein